MDKFVVEGGIPLRGEIRVSGSKNSCLPILAATILSDGECVIHRVPRLRDVETMVDILRDLGVDAQWEGEGTLRTIVRDASKVKAPYERVRTMRASFCVLGPLVARRGKAVVSLPGGCVIGVRPVDLHLKGLKALGAEVVSEAGYVMAESPKLTGRELFLGGAFGSSVTGTANVMMAATLAKGTTVIENAACEPELADLGDFLTRMGAKIHGAGTHRVVIEGVEKLHGAETTVIPDRIETGTYMVAAAATVGDVRIRDCRPDHLGALIDKLGEAGIAVEHDANSVRVIGPKRYRAVHVTTLPYPAFPTDLQAQMMALLATADGISVITERIYPDRFMHVPELIRMGADIIKEGPNALIHGIPELHGAPVMASDLRASAALVIAALSARGTTDVLRVYHIDRGYERIDIKLAGLGARIQRAEDVRGGAGGGEGE